ncbi:MAG: FkbM family methyltransferase [Bacteroidetes bacterium]|nr:MAG: FkbM family methyltransferase [Bacteroidota bacterium]
MVCIIFQIGINHIATENEENTISVPIETLDLILKDTCPSLIKIDVEGFETEVLKGAQNTLNNPILKAIIIELNGSGGRYGFNELDIHQNLLNLGFKPYSYLPFERKLTEIPTFGNYNTIYIRNLRFVEARLLNSKSCEIFNKVF